MKCKYYKKNCTSHKILKNILLVRYAMSSKYTQVVLDVVLFANES